MTIYELITQHENIALSPRELTKQLYPEYRKYFKGTESSLERKIQEIRSLNKVEPAESIEKVSKQQRQIVKLGQTNSEKDKLIKYQHSLIEQYEKKIEVWEALQNYNPESYIIRPENKNVSESHPIICISDVHYEKNIDKDVVNGLNHYNREIAKLRLSTAFQRGLKITKMYNQDVKIKDLTLVFGGDLIDGHLRDENLEENSLSPIEALMELVSELKSGIDYLLNNSKYDIRVQCLLGNHCIDFSTEVLTKSGFIQADKLKNTDLIANFDKTSGDIIFTPYLDYKIFEERGYFEINSNWKNETITKGHNLIINNEFVKISDLKYAKDNMFRHSGEASLLDYKYSDDELRLITWIITDGCMVDCSKYMKNPDKSIKKRIQFKLSKERKIKSLTELLQKMQINYTIHESKKTGVNKLQPYIIRFYGDMARKYFNLLNCIKTFPNDFINLSKRQVNIVLGTLAETDGWYNGYIKSNSNSLKWITTSLNDVNIIQIMCVINGYACRYAENIGKSGFDSKKTQYTVYINKNPKINNDCIIEYIDRLNKFVLITTDRGTLITRKNGVVNFTGNSRNTDKIQHANFYKHSYEWILYHQLKSYYNDKRVRFMIEKSYLSYIDIYDKVIRLQHGNNINFGGGIGGLTTPIIKAIHSWNSSKRATFDIIHDKHRWIPSDIFCVNGSVCGYDAYAGSIKAEYQKPIQTHLMFNSNPNWRYPINTPIYLETEEEKKFWD